MEHFSDDKKRRTYSRSSNIICKLFISKKGNRWTEVEIKNVSASGAKFITDMQLEKDEEIFIKIDIVNVLSEFTFTTTSKIVRKDENNTYAAQFINLEKTSQIIIDEIIQSTKKDIEQLVID